MPPLEQSQIRPQKAKETREIHTVTLELRRRKTKCSGAQGNSGQQGFAENTEFTKTRATFLQNLSVEFSPSTLMEIESRNRTTHQPNVSAIFLLRRAGRDRSASAAFVVGMFGRYKTRRYLCGFVVQCHARHSVLGSTCSTGPVASSRCPLSSLTCHSLVSGTLHY